jgi:hypothetical protein
MKRMMMAGFLVLAGTAGAQTAPHDHGGSIRKYAAVLVVDSKGKIVGRVVGASPSLNTGATQAAMRSIGGVEVAIPFVVYGGQFGVEQTNIWYAGANCSGQAYITSSYSGARAAAVNGTSLYIADDGGFTSQAFIASYLYNGQTCQPYGGNVGELFRSSSPPFDLQGFTPPFALR